MGCFQTTGTPKPPTSNHWLKPMEVQGCRCTRCLASQPISQGWGLPWQPTFASWWWTVDTCRCIETVWKNMWVHWKNGGLKSEFQILGVGAEFFLGCWVRDFLMLRWSLEVKPSTFLETLCFYGRITTDSQGSYGRWKLLTPKKCFFYFQILLNIVRMLRLKSGIH